MFIFIELIQFPDFGNFAQDHHIYAQNLCNDAQEHGIHVKSPSILPACLISHLVRLMVRHLVRFLGDLVRQGDSFTVRIKNKSLHCKDLSKFVRDGARKSERLGIRGTEGIKLRH